MTSEVGELPTEVARTDRGLLLFFLAVRAVHVAQGVICLVSGWRSYRRRPLVAATLSVAVLESAWLARRGLTTGVHDSRAANADTVVSVAGLLAIAASTYPADRTTSLNWMMPYGVGAAVGAAIASPGVGGASRTASVAATYALTAFSGANEGPGVRPTALANIASYGGFFAVVKVVRGFMFRSASELDEARYRAAEQAERLAVERERNSQYRLIHDSALQTLEAVARGRISDDAMLRSRARREAGRLRRILSNERPDRLELLNALESVAADFEDFGLHVELVADDIDRQPQADVTAAFAEATREALANVAKHAGVGHVVVRVQPCDGGIEVVVRDQGVGFDPEASVTGFGTVQSIVGRMADVSGRVQVWSRPGRGTRIVLWGPV